MSGELRLTWVRPEDLLGHELRQAAQDGRDASAVERRWLAAGGRPAPERAGASAGPQDPALRRLAERLLDELAWLPTPSADREPAGLAAIRAACPDWPAPGARPPLDRVALETRLHAGWLGRAVGCVLGKPVEKLPLAAIRAIGRATGNWPLDTWFTARGLPAELAAAHPWNRRSAANSLAENIDGAPEDDDLNYPLLGLLLLHRHGHGFDTADVAGLWLDELPAGRTFTAERVAYRNLLAGWEPPATATHHNPFREWIGALIRADVYGYTHPGDPAGAAELAYRDAVLSHSANGVYGAMFAAAAIAAAAGGGVDVHGCLRAGLAVVPAESRLAEAVRFGVATARELPAAADFDAVVDRLHARYGDHHWVHVLPNAALLAAALTHADGDFTASVCRAVSGGWDTDSNGATAGSLAGLLAGAPEALPARWTAPLKNRLATSIAGFDGIGFDELAALTLEVVA
ncbi:ADP-ribosylglycohydrolase family protein [Streptomyces millisiae]|uniref:ADP-ribosylglycohydrolase family protein n=1 Tax=Streptomyces millisiae TaxID=3075542 RepID=A0ABU2LK34_9ACTN|nr:ADP-ribosylglycohydrolase family protein [Streptomyces sp. DSM 44918]MDT0317598.1 ADP-ribosylglycohydrolase family protein [Streptomyces sp. DSM 44918]